MSFESRPHSIEGEGNNIENLEKKSLRVSNEIQMSIMSHECFPADGEEGLDRWINENGDKFRNLFERVVRDDPSILDKWESNQAFYLDFFMEELRNYPDSEDRLAA